MSTYSRLIRYLSQQFCPGQNVKVICLHLINLCKQLAQVVQRVDNAIQQISIGKTNYAIHWILLSTL